MSNIDKIIQDAAAKLMGWKLPYDFYPDCYIHFDMAAANASGGWPTGTNLLHVGQATDMLEYCIGDALRTALAEREVEIERLNRTNQINKEQVAMLCNTRSDCCRLYEELRTVTDSGSESMTHEDAVEHVKNLYIENETLRAAAQQGLGALQRVDAVERGMVTTNAHHYAAREETTASIAALTAALESKT